MDFADVNWLTILKAVILNMLLGYLFFESRLAKAKSEAVTDGETGNAQSPFIRYFSLCLYSAIISAFFWILHIEFAFSLTDSLFVLWMLIIAVSGITHVYTGYRDRSMFIRETWFFVATSYLTMIVIGLES